MESSLGLCSSDVVSALNLFHFIPCSKINTTDIKLIENNLDTCRYQGDCEETNLKDLESTATLT